MGKKGSRDRERQETGTVRVTAGIKPCRRQKNVSIITPYRSVRCLGDVKLQQLGMPGSGLF